MTLGRGQQMTGITINLSDGGSTVRGVVTAGSKDESISQNFRVFLVPTDPKLSNDPFHFFQDSTQSSGQFAFKNVQPGRLFHCYSRGE